MVVLILGPTAWLFRSAFLARLWRHRAAHKHAARAHSVAGTLGGRGRPLRKIVVTVNNTRYEKEVEPRQLLVYFLRDTLGLTGTNVGCDTSTCGACTVLLDGKAVKSCTLLGVQADGSEVTTIEGMAKDGELHPLQRAFHENHALQCGFCTPGFIMAAADLIESDGSLSDDDIRIALEGNLCRCTGYHNIVKAVREAASAKAGESA
jgi:aerobic carbon-monoxide dehydrogenase small subunit